MVSKILSKSKKFIFSPQSSVLSAATIIMLMVVASRVLGLVRQRTLAHFFAPGELSLFFAAFRLPDLVFEVLVFGTFSSAFIPVFTKTFQKKENEAWEIASQIVNIGLLIFGFFALMAGLAAHELYGIFAPGFSPAERVQIVKIARVLFIAQGFFVVSYVLTGVLESLRRFLVPALAPLFYNLGIILGIILWGKKLGLMAPAFGVFMGAFFHLAIQLPLALKLGFRFKFSLHLSQGIKKIGRLALPRVFELSFLQIGKTVELFLASLISTAAYTYYTFGNSLQLLPVGLFGTSIAKAALPTLASQSDAKEKFRNTLFNALYQMVFLILPVATILVVLRIPLVRLAFGTKVFDWQATVQTGLVVSAFALGIVFQSAAAVLVRAFYALHDTRTPVKVSVIGILITIVMNLVFIKIFFLPAWGLAAAFSLGSAFQAIVLFYLINKRMNKISWLKAIAPMIKPIIASLGSGLVMFVLLKIFDRSVWVKRLSFLGKIEATSVLPFEKFVLDTRYTVNLLVLTIIVSLVGLSVYLVLSILLRTKEVWVFFNLIKRIFVKRKVTPIPTKEVEPVVPTPTETTSS